MAPSLPPATAQVITLPVQKVASAAGQRGGGLHVGHRLVGRDHTLARIAGGAVRLRWSIVAGGHERLPESGPALVVVNARRFMLTPWFTALALSRQLDRPVRFVGRPDTAPVGAFARRLGGLLARPDEVAAALRDGQILVVGATGTLDPRRVGDLDHRVIGAAVRTKSPVFPASVTVSPIGRSARIEIGDAVRPPHRRRGPFAELELAERLESVLAEQLDTSGAPRTGTPLDWIPVGFSLSGGA